MKYMGPRAKGYCNLLHKSATGVYTGSKFNVGKKRRGLRADGSELLLSLPTRVFSDASDLDDSGIEEFSALAVLDLPSIEDSENLSFREDGHELRIGERFLVNGGDGIYALTVLDPSETHGWAGEPAIICGDDLLCEQRKA
jgi:hypothetical protein